MTRNQKKYKHDHTMVWVAAIAILAIVTILVITTAASARMMHTDPVKDFTWCMTHEEDLT